MSAEFLAAIAAPSSVSAGALPNLAAAAPNAPWDAPFEPVGATTASGHPFGTLVTDGLSAIDRQLQASAGDLRQLASGDVANLHHVMIRLEEARLSFQLMLQVRNRLLESYQDVMRMQV